jgi:peroxiredoxin Q/BCP
MTTIHPGMPAPPFRANDLFGNPIDLADYTGKTVLVSFFRNAACALCNLRVHHLIARYDEFARKGMAVIAVFESPSERMLEYVAQQDAPFPLVADPQARLYDLYGVEASEEKLAQTMAMPETQMAVQAAAAQGFALTQEPGSNFTRMPADFLIDPDGVVLRAHYANYITDHLPFDVIEQQLAEAARP